MKFKLSLVLLFFATCFAAEAQTSSSGTTTDGYVYYINNGTAKITGYTGTSATPVIPTSISTIPVTLIDIGAFSNNTTLTSITLPLGLLTINAQAFSGCTALKTIIIPNTVTAIGQSAFSGCTALATVTLSSNLSSLQTATFQNCTALTSITLPASLQTIDYSAFTGCSNLSNVVVQNTAAAVISVQSLAGTKLTVPYAPTNVTAVVGDTSALVNFVAGNNGGLTVTKYTVSTVGGITATGNSSPIKITGLTDAISYNFFVTATNAIGNSPNSALSNAVIPATAPVILSSPSSQTITTGTSLTLAVSASGTPQLQYQWFLNGVLIPGATLATYSITSAATTNNGTYTVTVTNSAGTVTSNAAILSVLPPPPVILTQPISQTVTTGSSVTFSLGIYGVAAAYQWYLNGYAIPGAVSPTYTVPYATASTAGAYTVTVTNAGGTITSNPASLTITTNPGRIINLSVLSMDGPGSQLLTVGFVSGGSGTTGSQNLLIRGSGPTLTAFSVTNVLPDPTLTVFSGQTAVATNDNWGSSPANITAVNAADTATGAFAFSATTSLDAAVVTTLASGNYTAQISGKNNATGYVLAEIYDNTPAGTYTSTTPRLVNVSSLEQIASNGFLTAGFVIGGNTAIQVLIRASGPTLALAPYKVANTLLDPKVTVFNSASTILASNAGWSGDPTVSAAITNTGAFPFASTASKDSAVVLTLNPGSYTVQATSASGNPGVTLIEVYEVPSR
jgi:BspA type Leucine rich repeat region (6 copies)/Immunoglobulin domain